MTSQRDIARSPAKDANRGLVVRAVCCCAVGGRGQVRHRYCGGRMGLTKGVIFTSLGLLERRGCGKATCAVFGVISRSCPAAVISRPRGRRRVQTL